MNQLADAKWPDLQNRPLVLIPVGSIEQHGPHLPLATDAAIAEAVARRVAQAVGDAVVVAPAISYGASGEHQDFPGTSSIGTETLRQVVIELARSMSTWAGRLVFVNAHGGNVTALSSAVTQLIGEGRDVGWVACATEDVDAHAGYSETSLMLHLQPSAVKRNLAEAGNSTPLAELLPVLKRHGVKAVSPNGVLGDPAGADGDEGARSLESMTREVFMVLRGRPDSRGVLRRAVADEVG